MTESSEKMTGGCLCGSIRYEATGTPLNSIYCHCNSCRRHAGTPVVALVGFPADKVRFTKGDRKLYESSPGVHRAFCGQCGTPLTWEGDDGEGNMLIELLTGTLDNPGIAPPESHNFYGERIAWFETADKLPRHETYE